MNLKLKLLLLEGFIDNEFLDKYVQLVERNRRTSRFANNMNTHHIIPRSWYKLHNTPVDNTLVNLVNLTYRNHVLAHYFLCLCTTDKLQYANELAFMLLISRKKLNNSEKLLIHELPLYNNIYESYVKKKKQGYQLYSEG